MPTLRGGALIYTPLVDCRCFMEWLSRNPGAGRFPIVRAGAPPMTSPTDGQRPEMREAVARCRREKGGTVVPKAPPVRFRVEPAYAPADKIARRLCLTEGQFLACARKLYARGFPLPDETTGMYDLEAVDRWLDKRPRAVAECLAEAAMDRAVDETRMPSFARIGYVYCIGYASYVKIGHTVHKIEYRLRSLQTACPERLHVYAVIGGSKTTERDLHKRFADLRLEGEWFRREGVLAEWIDAGCPL